ncbi:hypothetical protein HYFRA_00008585 [Hymenoscyphus fraxineus]|uniref:protein-tyrosine-phosphatase n=1 Tax=Hymenoscyphus fraxineus TaxID=746836 RepID=A0A9N9L0N6_9HELO|nr:hypothetical protein HYFRA_00008585 [Hymenoscyphus fraxineus]
MVARTVTRPVPRLSSSHTHSTSQTNPHITAMRPSTTPLSPSSRIPPSVGQPLPPHLRTPGNVDARTPSPNYFGLIVEPASDPRASAVGPKDNWGGTSSIVSFGADSPKHLPLDANPEFEAFRRQTEGGKGFNLGHGNLSHFASTPGSHGRPKPERNPSKTDNDDPLSPISPMSQARPERMDFDGTRGHHYPTPPRALPTPSFFDLPRQQSPLTITPLNPPTPRDTLSHLDDRHPRLSLPQNRANPPSPQVRLLQKTQTRGDTLPSSLEEGPALITPSQLHDLLERLSSSQYLLLDLRVSPQYAASRIQGALNLCIPTTLLKRPSFNLQKLQDTFSTDADKERFSEWRNTKYIIVYDSHSVEKKDALSAVNTLKKFANEGWTGTSYILRGGFAQFSRHCPNLIDDQSSQDTNKTSKITLSLGTSSQPPVAPVAGGCQMPATKDAANPFFGNIRQNTDLIDGVGQIDLKVPDVFHESTPKMLPTWLSAVIAKEDHGKKVADKFLRLELAEQSRMTKALSNEVQYGTPAADSKHVQIAGIEKGSKNRYNNIWPFEHARVKLQNRPEGTCDYVNASHIHPSRSNKRYIASQGPLPATFEDFWSVVWDQDVRVIVMLTAEKEDGRLKCHQYWENQQLGPLQLRGLSEKKISLDSRKHQRPPANRGDSGGSGGGGGRRRAATTSQNAPPPLPQEPPHAIVRKFTLSHSGQPFSPMREITQVHYSSWPDFGAPASSDQLLNLVELTNLMQRAAASSTSSPRSDDPELNEAPRPILVHCSAGCGRTGTFCTIDSVIDMLKRQRKEITSGITPMEGMTSHDGDYMGKGKKKTVGVDSDWIFDQDLDLIEKTVEDFRGQRLSMVQSLRQYVLCYEAILEWIAQQTTNTGRSAHERAGSVAF